MKSFENKIWNEKICDKFPPIIVGEDDVFNSGKKYGNVFFGSNTTVRGSKTCWFKGFVTAIELAFSTPSLNVYKTTESDAHAY